MKIVTKIAEWISLLGLGAMSVLAVANVFTRKAFSFTITWSDEIVIFIFVWLTMLGAANAFLSNAHLSMDFAPSLVGNTGKKILATLSLACTVFVGSFLVVYGVQLFQRTMRLGTATADLKIPKWTESLSVPVGGALIVVFAIVYYFRFLKSLKGEATSDDDINTGGVIA